MGARALRLGRNWRGGLLLLDAPASSSGGTAGRGLQRGAWLGACRHADLLIVSGAANAGLVVTIFDCFGS